MKTKLILVGIIGLVGFYTFKSQNASSYSNAVPIVGVNCTAFGAFALTVNGSTDANNTALGWSALVKNNGGHDNTASGSEALRNNLTGNYNTAHGRMSLYSNSTGIGNSSTGYQALYSNSTGNYNSAFGKMALFSNTIADGNSAFGDSALYSNTTGTQNSAFGRNALLHNSTGLYNTAFGAFTLYQNTTGNFNSAFGDSALYLNTTGQDNVAIGRAALYSSTTSSYNVAIGDRTLYRNTTGVKNVAICLGALFNNVSGSQNIAIGESALLSNTTGQLNVAIGSFALESNFTGLGNTAVGLSALHFGTGSLNTSIGYASMANIGNTGARNSALGSQALLNNSTGQNNTSVGYNSLGNCRTGNQNSGLGYNANMSNSGDTNATAVGASAVVNASNKVRLGDVNVTVVEGQVAYSFPSDGRFKTNIKTEDVKGLEFIKKLRPVVYNFDGKKFTEFLTKNMPDSVKKNYLNSDFKASTAIRQSGFIAQEVEQAAKEVGYDFNGLHKPNNDNDNYSLAYSQFVVPLVKAVQEQQQMIDTQNKTINDLKNQVTTLIQQSTLGSTTGIRNQSIGGSSALDVFSMGQNVPNPFTHETIINYNLPQTVNNAYMAVYDLSGKQLITFSISQKGASSLTITSDKLAPGIYIYSIIADGTILGSKRMVIADK